MKNGMFPKNKAGRVTALALALLLAAGCSPGEGGAVSAGGAVSQAQAQSSGIKVKVIPPEVGTIDRHTDFSGTIEASSTVNVYSEVQGKVKTVYVNEGETVQQGQLLFELDDSDLQDAADTAWLTYQSQLSQAQSSILNAEDS